MMHYFGITRVGGSKTTLQHGSSPLEGREKPGHRWIDRKRGKNGKWQYTYETPRGGAGVKAKPTTETDDSDVRTDKVTRQTAAAHIMEIDANIQELLESMKKNSDDPEYVENVKKDINDLKERRAAYVQKYKGETVDQAPDSYNKRNMNETLKNYRLHRENVAYLKSK